MSLSSPRSALLLRSSPLAVAIALAVATEPSIAHADPVVIVEVRRDGAPAEATVFLRDADGVTGTCRTSAGTCRMERVPPGRHYVWARDEAGRESVERPVMLPPDGEVTLVVAAP